MSEIILETESNEPTPKEPTAPPPSTPPAENKDTPTETARTTDPYVEALLEIAGLDMTLLAQEYETKGSLSDESYKELAENGFPKEIVDTYIRGVKAQTEEGTKAATADVQEVLAIAGGEEQYSKLVQWASTKLSPDEQDAYNKAVSSGDKYYAKLAVGRLVAEYEKEYGKDPALINGEATKAETPAGYKNRSEMAEAMNDKRYGKDEQYTREVEQKVLSSGLMKSRRRR